MTFVVMKLVEKYFFLIDTTIFVTAKTRAIDTEHHKKSQTKFK